jgi:hypothetical protein
VESSREAGAADSDAGFQIGKPRAAHVSISRGRYKWWAPVALFLHHTGRDHFTTFILASLSLFLSSPLRSRRGEKQ